MTDIEQKALALVNEVAVDFRVPPWDSIDRRSFLEDVLCRALERHEVFRREVSDAVEAIAKAWGTADPAWGYLRRFILTKPDPLVEAVNEAWGWRGPHPDVTENLRAAIEARGGRIVWEGE